MLTHLTTAALAQLEHGPLGPLPGFGAYQLNAFACTGLSIFGAGLAVIGLDTLDSWGGELRHLPTCPTCAVKLDEALLRRDRAPTRP